MVFAFFSFLLYIRNKSDMPSNPNSISLLTTTAGDFFPHFPASNFYA